MPKSRMFATVVTAATLAAAPVIVTPVMAQQSTVPATVTEPELDAFVMAYKDVVAIEQEYGARLEGVDDSAQQQAIISEAQIEMTQAVEEAPDIEVDRYIEILQLAQTDPELQAELTARLQE